MIRQDDRPVLLREQERRPIYAEGKVRKRYEAREDPWENLSNNKGYGNELVKRASTLRSLPPWINHEEGIRYQGQEYPHITDKKWLTGHAVQSPTELAAKAHDTRPIVEEPVNGHTLIAGDKDLTVHLELDVGFDLEPVLEDFSRFNRLGDFLSAQKCFEERLEEHIDDAYVLTSYAQMLLNMGNYRDLSALGPNIRDGTADSNLYQSQIFMIKACCNLFTGEEDFATHRDDIEKWVSSVSENGVGLEPPLKSGTIQLLSLHNMYFMLLNRHCLESTIFSLEDAIGKGLNAQGRIWDWRDIYVAEFSCNRHALPENNSTREKSPATLCREILAQWKTHSTNEATCLALLDVLTCLAVDRPLTFKTIVRARCFVNHAQDMVATIAEHFPNALKSRQYTRWLLAKVAVQTYQEPDHSPSYEGIYLDEEDAVDLPIYVPFQHEVPPLRSKFRASEHIDKIRLALMTAQELGDYQTEAICLKQLILRSSDPEPILDDLFFLQCHTQRDIHGCLRTLLAKYFLCSKSKSRVHLREQIDALGSCTNLMPSMQWAHFMMLRALARTGSDANRYLELAKSLQDEVTVDIRRFMLLKGWLDGNDGTQETSQPRQQDIKVTPKVPETNGPHPLPQQGDIHARAHGEESGHGRGHIEELASTTEAEVDQVPAERSEEEEEALIEFPDDEVLVEV